MEGPDGECNQWFLGCVCVWGGGGGGGAGIGDVSWVEITKVHVLDILVGVDFDDSFHNFCNGGGFLKE